MKTRLTPLIAWLLCAGIIATILFDLVRAVFNGALSVESSQLVSSLVQGLIPISFALVGSLILSQQSRNVIGWLLILPALSFAMSSLIGPLYSNLTTAPEAPSVWLYLALYVNGVSWVFFIFPLFFLALLFPTGKPLSPRWRWVIAYGAVLLLFFLVLAALAKDIGPVEDEQRWVLPNPIGFITQDDFDTIFGLPWGIALGSLTLLSLASLVVRYWRAGGVERQQLKWLLFAAAFFAAAYVPAVLAAGEMEGFGRYILDVLFLSAALAFPIAIGIAILRYRLWDIDVIIRRTMTYALVTAMLLVIFFGSVIVLQQLFAQFTNTGGSEIITVISTLTIAALFVPLRNRVQSEIDKRFNRKKYDAQKIMENFSRTVRDETDIDTLTNELVNVVQETMQPKSVTLWLKKESKK